MGIWLVSVQCQEVSYFECDAILIFHIIQSYQKNLQYMDSRVCLKSRTGVLEASKMAVGWSRIRDCDVCKKRKLPEKYFIIMSNYFSLLNVRYISPNIAPRLQCGDDQFDCRTGGCIDIELSCDGIDHCLDGSDENDDMCGKYITTL